MIRIHLEPTLNAHELISLSCNKIMSLKKRNQPASKKPILQMDTTTFQAAVIAVMTHLNANNTNGSGIIIGNPNQGNNQVHQRVPTCKDTPNLQRKNKKRMFLVKKVKSPQKLANSQQPMTASTTTTSVTPTSVSTSILVNPTSTRKCAWNLPKCNE